MNTARYAGDNKSDGETPILQVVKLPLSTFCTHAAANLCKDGEPNWTAAVSHVRTAIIDGRQFQFIMISRARTIKEKCIRRNFNPYVRDLRVLSLTPGLTGEILVPTAVF